MEVFRRNTRSLVWMVPSKLENISFFTVDASSCLGFLFLKSLAFFGLHTTAEALCSDGLHQLKYLQFDPFDVAVSLVMFDLAHAV